MANKRVLLDESMPRQLARHLAASGISTTPYPNDWKQTKNGDLLTLAEQVGYNVLVTSDSNIYAQQNLRGRSISIVVLPTNLRRYVMARAADVADTILRIEAAQYVVIEPNGARPVINYNADNSAASDMPPVKPFEFRRL